MGSLTLHSTTQTQIIGSIMRNLFLVSFCLTLLGGLNSYSVLESDSQRDGPIRCYSCTSQEGGQCDDENYGTEKECQPGHGCYISQETIPGGEQIYIRDCAESEHEEDLRVQEGEEGGNTKSCHCSTELCNKNWVEAGSTDKPDDPTEQPPPPKMKCFKCNSNDGPCSDDQFGEETECEGGFGCLISRESGEGSEIFVRDCLAENVEDKYQCETMSPDGNTVNFCKCPTELCNRNWVEAGSTENPDGTTDKPTEPAVETIKCFSCDSNNGDGTCDDEHSGTEIDCEKKRGCNIMTNKDLYTRGCSVNMEASCSEEADTRSCDCLEPLCNRNWKDAGAEAKLKCYSCSSDAGDCDDDHAGTEIDCAVEAGCVISKDIAGVYMRGCSGEVEPTPGCDNKDNATTCFCMSNLCNFNWENAGSTTAGSDTTITTPAGPVLKCYKCESDAGDCSEEAHGEEVECPQNKGCTIRKTTDSNGVTMMRDCSEEKDITCDTTDNGEGLGTTQFCNCDTSLCNADWSTAGSTQSPPDTTHDHTHDHPTQEHTTPGGTTPAPGTAHTLCSSCLLSMVAIVALIFNVL